MCLTCSKSNCMSILPGSEDLLMREASELNIYLPPESELTFSLNFATVDAVESSMESDIYFQASQSCSAVTTTAVPKMHAWAERNRPGWAEAKVKLVRFAGMA